MARLRRQVIVTTVRWEETEPLTEEQIMNWESNDWELQDRIMEEVEFDLKRDKVLEDNKWPELIKE
jgi:hypothetical protein